MTDDWTEPVGSEYAGPERRRRPRVARVGPILPTWALVVLLALAYLAIMLPLGMILHYASRTDGRAERANLSTCKLASVVADQAHVLSAGIAVLNAPSDAELRERVRNASEQLDRATERAEKACRDTK